MHGRSSEQQVEGQVSMQAHMIRKSDMLALKMKKSDMLAVIMKKSDMQLMMMKSGMHRLRSA